MKEQVEREKRLLQQQQEEQRRLQHLKGTDHSLPSGATPHYPHPNVTGLDASVRQQSLVSRLPSHLVLVLGSNLIFSRVWDSSTDTVPAFAGRVKPDPCFDSRS